ncbi:hypothetical protein GCM10017687_24370 [Streptomyces echinatus]
MRCVRTSPGHAQFWQIADCELVLVTDPGPTAPRTGQLLSVEDWISTVDGTRPRWSSGRVALVGDAAYAPSFLTGQGSSLALVGAYMLAGSLADRDHASGFAAYEHDTRGFVTMNQEQIGEGDAMLFPTTARALEQRNAVLRDLSAMPSAEEHRPIRPSHCPHSHPRRERGHALMTGVAGGRGRRSGPGAGGVGASHPPGELPRQSARRGRSTVRTSASGTNTGPRARRTGRRIPRRGCQALLVTATPRPSASRRWVRARPPARRARRETGRRRAGRRARR